MYGKINITDNFIEDGKKARENFPSSIPLKLKKKIVKNSK